MGRMIRQSRWWPLEEWSGFWGYLSFRDLLIIDGNYHTYMESKSFTLNDIRTLSLRENQLSLSEPAEGRESRAGSRLLREAGRKKLVLSMKNGEVCERTLRDLVQCVPNAPSRRASLKRSYDPPDSVCDSLQFGGRYPV